MLRRLTLPVVLLLTVVVAGFEAWRTDRATAPAVAAATTPAPAAATPVLSVRRAPEWLQRPVADASLRAALDAVIAASPTDTCLVVREQGRVLYSRNPTLPLTPASTVKLLTAYASLDRLGEKGAFDTVALATAAPQAGVITGNLVIVGGGDAILATQEYVDRFGQTQPFTDVQTLVDRIAAAGVTQIRGDVVGDESRYDAKRYVATWDQSFINDHESGPISALALNDGFATWPRTKFSFNAVPADDPAQRAAAVVRELLEKKGVRVTGTARSGKAPAGAVEVARVSATAADLVSEMLSQSDNQTAESLTKELGLRAKNEGSTAAGVAAARDALTAAGLPMTGVSVVDGSGLDRSNKLTCDFLATILDRVGEASTIGRALPVAGRTGTLAERFVGTAAAGRIHAKTGSLRNTRALAGFADAGRGDDVRTLTFAYIANQANLNTEANLKVQDQLGIGLTAYPQAPSLQELGPR